MLGVVRPPHPYLLHQPLAPVYVHLIRTHRFRDVGKGLRGLLHPVLQGSSSLGVEASEWGLPTSCPSFPGDKDATKS